MISNEAIIHPLAHVGESVSIGAKTRVWQFASIVRGTVLGERCQISPFVMLDGSVYGDDVKIQSHFAAGPGFWVGDRVFIGPNVSLCNDMWPSVDREGYDDRFLRGQRDFTIIIEDDVSIGANCVILPGVRIGTGARIAAYTRVSRDVPGGMLLKSNGYMEPFPDRRERMRNVSQRFREQEARRKQESK